MVARRSGYRAPARGLGVGQMSYLVGANLLHRSFIVGCTGRSSDHSVRHPHHRAVHGSLSNDPDDPPEHRHTLCGALVGGSDALDQHVDHVRAHRGNEVALDYNAGLAGAPGGGLVTHYPPGPVAGRWTPSRLGLDAVSPGKEPGTVIRSGWVRGSAIRRAQR